MLLLPFMVCGQKIQDVARLSGIINLTGGKEAVFEFVTKPGEALRHPVMVEGDIQAGVKLLKILPDRGVVEVSLDGIQTPLTLRLEPNSVIAAGTTIELTNSSLHSVLELYGEFSERTLLHWPVLPPVTFSLTASPRNKAEAALVLQKALAEKGLTNVSDGENFTMIIPIEHASSVKPHAPKAKPLNNAKPHPEELPPGTIRLNGAPVEQVFEIYADLVGGKFDRASPRPAAIRPSKTYFFARSALSREECVYVLETLFDWRGIKMKRDADGSVKAIQEPKK